VSEEKVRLVDDPPKRQRSKNSVKYRSRGRKGCVHETIAAGAQKEKMAGDFEVGRTWHKGCLLQGKRSNEVPWQTVKDHRSRKEDEPGGNFLPGPL